MQQRPQRYIGGRSSSTKTGSPSVRRYTPSSTSVPCKGSTLEVLHPWEAILDHGKAAGCDLVVMASRGRRGVAALLLGSETQKVLTRSTQPMLVVR